MRMWSELSFGREIVARARSVRRYGGRLQATDFLAVAVLCVCVGVTCGYSAPYGNEWIYFAKIKQFGGLDGIHQDWTLSHAYSHSWLFNALASVLLGLPTWWAIWLGRLLGWACAVASGLWLAANVGLKPRAAAAAGSLWICVGQSLVGGEWVVGGFEGKTFSYACLFVGLAFVIRRQPRVAGLMAGLAFALHPVVGLWGGVALFAALTVSRVCVREVIFGLGLCVVIALPTAWNTFEAIWLTSGEEQRGVAEFIVRTRIPHHVNPGEFSRRLTLELGIIAAFNVLHGILNWQTRALRILTVFEACIVSVFIAGIAAWLAGAAGLLLYFPFRVAGVLIPLFFLWRTVLMLVSIRSDRKGPTVCLEVLLIIGMMGLPNPLGGAYDRASYMIGTYRSAEDPLAALFAWIRENTSRDARVVVPPWRDDVYLRAERGTVATWKGVTYATAGEWRERIRCLLGGALPGGPPTRDWLEARYFSLTEAEVLELGQTFDADLFVSQRGYGFPVASCAGDYCVYRIR